jgi:hypothetical protein
MDVYNSILDDYCVQALAEIDQANIPEPARSMYKGAASACLAAFHNRPELWPPSDTALVTAQPQTSKFNCIDMAIYQLLKSLAEAHRQDPSTQFVKKVTESGGPCPRITQVSPDHGPAQGGYQVRIIGVNLPSKVGVHFGDRYFTVATSSSREVLVTVPPTSATKLPAEVSVWVDGWPFASGEGGCCFAGNEERFTYE